MTNIWKKLLAAALLALVGSTLFPVVLKAEPTLLEKCKNFETTSNFFFEDFETYDYNSGFLSLHFKLKTPYNDGRGWYDKIVLYKQDCTFEEFKRGDPVPALSGVRAGMQYYSIRFSSPTHYDVWDDEQDVKLECDGCSTDIPATLQNGFEYSQVSYAASIDGSAGWFNSSSLPIEQQTHTKNPLLIIPGILGTELVVNEDKVWPNIARIITQPSDNFMDQLRMDSWGRPMVLNVTPGNIVESVNYGVGNLHYSDVLLQKLSQSGYTAGANLFAFNYDWRLSINDLAVLLQQRINQILQSTGAQKVDVIAHSMGGLLVKKMLLNVLDNVEGEAGEVTTTLGKVIFVGVPNLGSADAAKLLIFGDSLNIPFLNAEKMQFLAQNMPSVYQLLPTKEYFQRIAGYFDDLSNTANLGILNYEQSKQLLLNLGKNSQLIEDAEKLHTSAMDNFDLSRFDIDPYNIIGCGVFTLKTIHKMYYGKPGVLDQLLNKPKYRIYSESGDGTVLIQSAQYLSTPVQKTYFATNAQHSEILSTEGVHQLITGLINGAAPVLSSNISQNANNCSLHGKLISLPSKMEINITSPENGNLIPGVDYILKKIGDDTYVYLPTKGDKEYKVKAKAPADKKPVSIRTTDYSNNQTSNKNYENIPVEKEIEIDVKDDSEEVSNVNEEGNETQIPPTYTESAGAEDLMAPATKIRKYNSSVLLDSGNLDLTDGEYRVYLSAADNMSGVFDTQYSIDEQNWYVASEIPITLPLGTPSISFYSRDKAGNIEELKTVTLYWPAGVPPINTPPPTTEESPEEEPEVEVDLPVDEDEETEEEVEEDSEEEGVVEVEEGVEGEIEYSTGSNSGQNINVTVNVPINPKEEKEKSFNKGDGSANFYIVRPGFVHKFLNFIANLMFF